MHRCIGYARAAPDDPDARRQDAALRDLGCETVYVDRDGTLEHAEGWETCLQALQIGDTLVVARLEHLARTLAKLEDVLLTLDARQVQLRIVRWEPAPLLDAGELATITRHFIDFDTANHRELIKQGIAQARAEGRIGGRRHRLKPGQIEELKRAMAEPGADPVDVGKRFGVGRATVYKYLKHGEGSARDVHKPPT